MGGNLFKEPTPFELAQKELQTKKPSGVASFGFVYDKPIQYTTYNGGYKTLTARVVSTIAAACFASVANAHQQNKEAFYVWYNCNENKSNPEVSTWWLRFLLSEDSPWRDIVRGQPEQDFDFVYQYGYVLTNLDYPSNFFVNFLTAFRMASEKPKLVELWYRLSKDGCSHGIIAVILDAIHYGNLNNIVQHQGHYPFQLYDSDFEAPDRINAKTPQYKGLSVHTFKDNASFTPCNAIWSGPDYAKYKYTYGGMYGRGPLYRAWVSYLKNGPPQKVVSRMFGKGDVTKDTEVKSTDYETVRDFCLLFDKDKERLRV